MVTKTSQVWQQKEFSSHTWPYVPRGWTHEHNLCVMSSSPSPEPQEWRRPPTGCPSCSYHPVASWHCPSCLQDRSSFLADSLALVGDIFPERPSWVNSWEALACLIMFSLLVFGGHQDCEELFTRKSGSAPLWCYQRQAWSHSCLGKRPWLEWSCPLPVLGSWEGKSNLFSPSMRTGNLLCVALIIFCPLPLLFLKNPHFRDWTLKWPSNCFPHLRLVCLLYFLIVSIFSLQAAGWFLAWQHSEFPRTIFILWAFFITPSYRL